MKSQKKNIYIAICLTFLILSFLFISPVSRQPRSQFHSSQLTKKTEKDEKIERIDYIDANGRITIAADLGYATIILTKTDNQVLEKYYDDKGKPISRYNGYYALLRVYDDKGNNTRITYLNHAGEPMIMVNGYAAEEHEYNDKGKLIAVRYLDDKLNPIMSPLYGYGELYEYDEDNNKVTITYIDDSDAPMKTGLGYASVTRTYYSAGRNMRNLVENEMYFDEVGDPICLQLGQYGIHKEYDQYGRASVITYLDKNGEPIITNKGYTKIKRTYHPNGYVATEQYYDLDGKAFALSEGQYGISQDENQTVYLNKTGNELFNLKNIFYNHSWFVIPMTMIAIVLCSIVNKKWCILFLAVYFCVVLYFTLLFRNSNSAKNSAFLWSYKLIFSDSEARADILKNIWLFIPLGALLYRFSQNKMVLLIAIVFSIFIECIQYVSGRGLFEFDDIISNGFGATIGFYAEKLTAERMKRIKFWKHIHITRRR